MNEKLKLYLKKIDSKLFGEPEIFTKSFEGSLCDISTNWKDVISLYLTIDKDKIIAMNGKCGPCDPYAYAALYGLMKVIPGHRTYEINLSNNDLKEKFIKETEIDMDEEMIFHYETILRMLADILKKDNI
ncbi:MAG: hypothetical protein COX48_05215 [bacterium (Candidatus Stahlbacteria) CG23_combo_of_CG06-09_8_20_14_all_34_7]|nr:MAG: hypothetical protein COX48_05215 [bacterium (Candidatus Stahlbacteria) CG23_combo_of_CG06-09_8_20_14_all_34_7]